MRQVTIKRFILPVALISASSLLVWAGCISDCKDDYDTAVESCKSQYDNPEDADDLRRCLQDAKDAYESCIEECDS
jgi:outer membrane murein-binding lipoprotein Lpp